MSKTQAIQDNLTEIGYLLKIGAFLDRIDFHDNGVWYGVPMWIRPWNQFEPRRLTKAITILEKRAGRLKSKQVTTRVKTTKETKEHGRIL